MTSEGKTETSIKILNIPDPKDLHNSLLIRIYNIGSSESRVYGTLYNAKGVRLGIANQLLAMLKANTVETFSSTQLAKTFGVEEWGEGGGRAWIQIEGDLKQIRIQAFAKINR